MPSGGGRWLAQRTVHSAVRILVQLSPVLHLLSLIHFELEGFGVVCLSLTDRWVKASLLTSNLTPHLQGAMKEPLSLAGGWA